MCECVWTGYASAALFCVSVFCAFSSVLTFREAFVSFKMSMQAFFFILQKHNPTPCPVNRRVGRKWSYLISLLSAEGVGRELESLTTWRLCFNLWLCTRGRFSSAPPQRPFKSVQNMSRGPVFFLFVFSPLFLNSNTWKLGCLLDLVPCNMLLTLFICSCSECWFVLFSSFCNAPRLQKWPFSQWIVVGPHVSLPWTFRLDYINLVLHSPRAQAMFSYHYRGSESAALRNVNTINSENDFLPQIALLMVWDPILLHLFGPLASLLLTFVAFVFLCF